MQKIGRCSLTGEFTEFPVPRHGNDGPGGPRCITKGSDGNLWFTEWKANKIGRLTPKGDITEFDIPTPGCGTIGIGPGPDGNVWYCANKGKRIGSISPQGKFTEYLLMPDSEPFLLTAGPDKNVWFSDEKDRVGRIKIEAPK
jgi:virginiamycin B lyase